MIAGEHRVFVSIDRCVGIGFVFLLESKRRCCEDLVACLDFEQLLVVDWLANGRFYELSTIGVLRFHTVCIRTFRVPHKKGCLIYDFVLISPSFQ